MQLENDDLRARLAYLESMTDIDSQMIRDNINEESNRKVDWAQYLFTLEATQEDLRILAASKDKIAHEILRLRTDIQKLQSQNDKLNGIPSHITKVPFAYHEPFLTTGKKAGLQTNLSMYGKK
jgi:chromosome segregation ATPase